MTPEQQRAAMPMTRYWHIKRGLRKGTESFFEPITFMFRMAADSLEVMAKHLQQAVFFKGK
jgi:hypothetical protein